MLGAFRLLAQAAPAARHRLRHFRPHRGAPRRAALIAEYEAQLDEIGHGLSPANHAVAVELAAVPLEIRGFGHIKEAALEKAKAKSAALIAQFRSPPPRALAAE